MSRRRKGSSDDPKESRMENRASPLESRAENRAPPLDFLSSELSHELVDAYTMQDNQLWKPLNYADPDV